MVAGEQVVLDEAAVGLERLSEIGAIFARVLRGGDVVLLYGPLGAGKTALVRVIAQALQVTDPVRSPSFMIANIYSGAMIVQHLDLYRVDQICDDDALALEEYVRDDAVTFVEWPQAGLGRLGQATWTVTLDHRSLEERSIQVLAGSAEAAQRWHDAHNRGDTT
ncbi:MAG: tRNA (adenosine(37)-N6)-threonylcarbamoyltransferase complex ATPase subunit type 1 TsaE [Actinobacteria bacterium]|nr:tRNA (adenosine(37)-N6)-threonylcarbamoyltransferase complex ATPase subunit type 1 TsaE [Actinomycetota bacterium]